ncbi:DUF6602 domain-containing protein [Ruminiclostridium papyrosolvens]|uniref:DUF6602 domain-containing protein n=1 Tax=Ruminiclostridium papyrosolvens C7 TaxID=1330534 RepID=U4R022_9FIRM|nr:DUF6602 domain-containing protein [Ruminiclostridium papyrosolvens]EPR09969.1 hypothetical protein L323_15465 [Ruminiclostridium papyrosolvens C7]
MNEQEYQRKLFEQLNMHDINLDLLSKWYFSILEQLRTSFERSSNIIHPRHRGDIREYDIKAIIKDIIPSSYAVTKGYAINNLSLISLEQDLLIYKKSSYSPFIKTSELEYLPIESIFTSIEIKSNLTHNELRKCILNCVSLKKLRYNNSNYSYKKEEGLNLFYCIFAYKSELTIEKIISYLNDYNKDIPENLRINMIYILNEGLILPAIDNNHHNITLNYKDIMKINNGYLSVPNLSSRQEEEFKALHFLLFLSLIVDLLIHDNSNQLPMYTNYVYLPIYWLQQIDSKRDDHEFIPKKGLSKGLECLMAYTEKCKKCGKEYTFYNKDLDEHIHNRFREQGLTYYDKTQEFIYCECGEAFNTSEFK